MKRLFRTFCYYVGVLIVILFIAVYMPPWLQSTFGFKIAMIYCFMIIVTTLVIIPAICSVRLTNSRSHSALLRSVMTLSMGTVFFGLRGLPATDIMAVVLAMFFYEIMIYIFHEGPLGDGNPD